MAPIAEIESEEITLISKALQESKISEPIERGVAALLAFHGYNEPEKIEELKTYIPYYEMVLPPTMNDSGVVVMSIKVRGTGDYLPAYAGNLDIINCAAIKVTERLVK